MFQKEHSCLAEKHLSRPKNRKTMPVLLTVILFIIHYQGGFGTGKTGNLVITFSRQGKHREIWTTRGIFQISLKMNYFVVNCPDVPPIFF